MYTFISTVIAILLLLALIHLCEWIVIALRRKPPSKFRPRSPVRGTKPDNQQTQATAASPVFRPTVFRSTTFHQGRVCTITGTLRSECDCPECVKIK